MPICRLFLRSLGCRSTPQSHPQALTLSLLSHQHETSASRNLQDGDFHSLLPRRTFAFSSAEEAAAERRRRKRRLRIEPPLHALRRDNYPPPPRDPNAPRLPDSTSALVGPRLNLHNRVQSLIRASDLDAASAVARHSVFSNTRPTVFTCNAIIAAMYRAKRYSDAIALFQFFFNQSNIVPNVVSYNNLINAHCDEGRVDVGLDIYRHIIANAPFSPSSVTYRHLTKGLIDAGRIGEAVDLLREMLNKGHGADSLVYNNLISGFLNLEDLEKANELFDELKERCLVYDGVVNATFMDWYFNKGKSKEAMESYKSLLDRQFKMIPATCNVLLEVLLKHGKKSEALVLFDQMLDNHTPPTFQAVNSDTFNIMVNECFKLGMFSEAVETFRKVGTQPKSKPFSMDVAGYNNIISKFCEHGMLSEAETFFEELCSKSLSPDVPTHRTLIDAYLKANKIDDALRVFNRMVDVGLRVVANFGNRVFEELIGNGKAVDCAQILTKMGEKEPKPDPTCYDVVIRGLCNESSFDLSRDLLEQMMRYGIGVAPTLREFLNEAFGRVGRAEEIESLVNMNRWGHVPYRPPSGPPRSNQQIFASSQGAQLRNTQAGPQMGGLGFQSQGQKAHGLDNSPSTLSGPQMGQSGFSSQQQMTQSVHNSQSTSGRKQMGGSGFSFQEQVTPSTQNFPSAPAGYQTGGSGYSSLGQGNRDAYSSASASVQMDGSGFPPARQMTSWEYNSPPARFQTGGSDFPSQGQMTQGLHNNPPAGFQGQMTPGVHNYPQTGFQIEGSGFPSQGQMTQVVHNLRSTTSEFSESHQPTFESSESAGFRRSDLSAGHWNLEEEQRKINSSSSLEAHFDGGWSKDDEDKKLVHHPKHRKSGGRDEDREKMSN